MRRVPSVNLLAFFALMLAAFAWTGVQAQQTPPVHFAGVQALVTQTPAVTYPEGVAFDAQGDLFIADHGAQKVYEIAAVNGAIPASPSITTIGSGFSGPAAVAVDASGNVYVADASANAVKEILAGGYTAVNTLASGFSAPQGVAVDAYGNVFVADTGNNQIKKIATGGSVSVIASGFTFSVPMGLALDASGNLYVADSGSGSIRQITQASGYSTVNTLATGFGSPQAVGLDASGNLFVADTSSLKAVELLAASGYQAAEIISSGTFHPLGVAIDARGNLFGSGYSGGTSGIFEAALAGGNFGPVNVGSTSAMIGLNFTFENGGSAASAKVLTQGVAGLDFTFYGTNCTSPVSAGAQCGVGITFTPTRPGPRYGAVELFDSSGNLLATGYVYGYGVSPQVAFPPAFPTQSYKQVTSSIGNGYQIALDGANNLYVADYPNNAIWQIPAAGGYANKVQLGSGFSEPLGVAVDGAGNVFVADTNHNSVKEIVAAGGYTTMNTLASGFNSPSAVAVDAGGNVFVADTGNNRVMELLAVNGVIPALPTMVTVGSGFSRPYGVAVDSNENVFVSNYTGNSVVEVHAVNGVIPASPSITGVGSGFSRPVNVAVDGSGNVYVADFYNHTVKEVLAAGGFTTVVQLAANCTSCNNISASGVAVDSSGNVFITGGNSIEEIDIADPPALTFPSTAVGQTSPSQTVTVQNTGNASLTFPIPNTGDNPSIGANFTWDPTGASACPQVAFNSQSPATLAAGAACNLPITFAPTQGGNSTAWLTLWDNSLNAPAPAYTTQNISLVSSGAQQVQPPTLLASFSSQTVALNGTVVETFNISNPNASSTLTGVSFLETLPSGLAVALLSANTCGGSASAGAGSGVVGISGVTLAGGASCSVAVTLTGTQTGVQVVATSVTSIEGGEGNSGNLSVTVIAPPVLAAAFTPGSITVYGNAQLTFTLRNSNSAFPFTNVGFTAALPSGLAGVSNALSAFASNQCGGSLNFPQGGSVLSLSGVTLSSSSSCTVTVYLTASATGTMTLTTGAPTSGIGPVTPATATLQVMAPPIFTVTSTGDSTTATASNCTDQSLQGATPDTNCRLRDAIAKAQSVASAGMQGSSPQFGTIVPTINFAAALTATGAAQITLAAGLNGSNAMPGVTINGPGSGLLTISGNNLYRVLNVSGSGYTPTSISGLTIANGKVVNGNGGGIKNNFVLTLTNVAITNNQATVTTGTGGCGGGLWNGGSLTLVHSTLSGNTASNAGGGLCNALISSTNGTSTTLYYGWASVTGSTIANNSAPGGNGGGIYNNGPGQCPQGTTCTSMGLAPWLSIVDSTIVNNTASQGGGMYNASPQAGFLTVTQSTVTGNSAATGGGIDNQGATLNLQNDIAVGNTATADAPDQAGGNFADGGGNLLGQSSGTGTSGNPNLASLGSYGGPTQTMPPLPGSTAICAGSAANIPSGLTTDQRGNPRQTMAYGSNCVDAGAVQTAYSLTFTQSPGDTTAGQILQPGAQVQLNDNGNPIAMAGAPVSIAAANGTLNGTTNVSSDGTGTAAFNNLSIATAESQDTLVASIHAGSHTVQATSSPFNIAVMAIVLTPSALPAGTVGIPYAQDLSASGGTGPYTFAVLNGTLLPAGLSLPGRTIQGTPTTAGSYSFSVTATDSNNFVGSQPYTLVINPATPALTVNCAPATYDGNAHTCTGTATGIGGTAVSGTWSFHPAAGTAAGSYPITGTFTSTDTNYTGGAASGTLVIARATATVTVTPYNVSYDGNAHTATGTATGVGGIALAGLTLSGTTHTNAGTYASDSWTFTDTTGNYNNANGTVNDSIGKATAMVMLGGLSQTYTGSPLAATATTTPPGLTVNLTYNNSATPPTAAGNYAVAATVNDANYEGSATGTMILAKATPTLTWSTPAAIPYGTALGAAQLNAASTVQGTFTYSPSAGTVLSAGPHTLNVTFTPSDTTGYTTGTASVALVVNQAVATITWPTPAAIPYGTALGSAQLNATASVPGSFAYNPAAGTVMAAGQQTLNVIFTPSDTTDYSSATATVILTVKKATPTVAWATPAAVVVGAALGSAQLNATASVPGLFAYNPAAGTVMNTAGNVTLSVTFTPTDSTDYNPATASVALAVNNPVPVIGSLSPALTNAGGAAFTLTVNGSGFVANSTIYWGTTALATQYTSPSQLTAQVPASNIANAGTAAITVQTPTPGGGNSGSQMFEIDSAGSGTTPPSFTTVTATITPGSSATYPVTVPSSASDVTVTCLNLPAGAACSYSAATGAVTITTSSSTPAGTYQITVVFAETLPGQATALVLLPIFLLPLAGGGRRVAARRRTWIMLCIGVALTVSAVCIGCGGSSSHPTHTVTTSGAVTLTVQ